jgi:hypothetical protein
MHNSLQRIENMQVAYQHVSLTFIVVNRVVCLEGQEKVIAVRDSVLWRWLEMKCHTSQTPDRGRRYYFRNACVGETNRDWYPVG